MRIYYVLCNNLYCSTDYRPRIYCKYLVYNLNFSLINPICTTTFNIFIPYIIAISDLNKHKY